MKDDISIDSNGLSVTVNLKVENYFLVKFLLIGGTLGFIVFSVFILYMIRDHLQSFALVFLLKGFVLFFFIKYLFWNLMGRERLVFSEKSLSYTHYFGGWAAKRKLLTMSKPALYFREKDQIGELKLGSIVFMVHQTSDQVNEVYETVVLVSEVEYHQIFNLFASLTVRDKDIHQGFPKYIPN